MKIFLFILSLALVSCSTRKEREMKEGVKLLNYQANLTSQDLLDFLKEHPELSKE